MKNLLIKIVIAIGFIVFGFRYLTSWNEVFYRSGSEICALDQNCLTTLEINNNEKTVVYNGKSVTLTDENWEDINQNISKISDLQNCTGRTYDHRSTISISYRFFKPYKELDISCGQAREYIYSIMTLLKQHTP
ncbi:MAG: hypothetical protein ACRCV6_07445 [Formosimonas sp.]